MWRWLTTRLPGLRRLFAVHRRSHTAAEQANKTADRADRLIEDYRKLGDSWHR